MEERARMLGGTVRVRSTPRVGTQITLRIPVGGLADFIGEPDEPGAAVQESAPRAEVFE